MKITIGHLYPDLLNLYGDRGNIQCLMKRCQWRGIEAETICYEINDEIDFSKLDIILLGGGSDREQMLVCDKLKNIKTSFQTYVEDNGVVIAICGGFQLLGNYYATSEGILEVPNDSFIPEPEVTSKVIKLNIRKEPMVNPKDKEKMFKIIKKAFMQKRKTLLNSLTNNKIFANKQQGIEILNSLGIDENIRPETLTLEQFAKISDNL